MCHTGGETMNKYIKLHVKHSLVLLSAGLVSGCAFLGVKDAPHQFGLDGEPVVSSRSIQSPSMNLLGQIQ